MSLDLSNFDLEKIKEYIELVLTNWGLLVQDVPVEDLPQLVYIIGTIIALSLWLVVTRILPKPLGRISWMLVFSILCSPTVNTTGSFPKLVPACVGFVYGALTKNIAILLINAIIMLTVFCMWLFVAFLWEQIKRVYIGMLLEKQAQQE